MKKDRSIVIIVSLTMSLLLTVCSLAWPEEVKIGAGAAATENILNRIKEPMEKSTGLKLTIISNGPVAAWKDLDKGLVDGAIGGLSFSDWMALMEKEGYKITDAKAYQQREIGRDTIRLILNKNVSVGKLGKQELKEIFTGKVTNWKDVGGPDMPIAVVLGKQIPGTQSFFQAQMMNGEAYLQSAVEATTADDVKRKVAATPGGVGLSPASAPDSSISVQGLPMAGRPITLITRGAPSPAVTKMVNFIEGEGQKYIFK
jgi:phosphate transport system substrate-binding protein